MATAPKLLEFPIEIFRPVIEYVHEAPTLLSLLVASRALNIEAERSLYHTLLLDSRHTPEQILHLLQRLHSCDRVARLVRRISIMMVDHPRFVACLADALGAVVNLKILCCHNYHLDMPPSLPTCRFQLKEFHWTYISDGHVLATFLCKQPLLETLEIDRVDQAVPLPPTACPNLSVFAGRTSEIGVFLPDRQIKCLRWNDPFRNGDDYIDIIREVAEPLSHLQALVLVNVGIGMRRPPEPVLGLSQLKSMSPYLPHLKYLAVDSIRNLDVECCFSLTGLRGVTLLAPNYDLNPGDAKAAARLFEHLQNLRFVELGHTWPTPTILQWKRSGEAPRMVQQADATPHSRLASVA